MSSMDLQSLEFSCESATINHLPNETLLYIFEHLKLKDLIRSRLVCKRFMLLCDAVRVPEVIISNKIENIRAQWFYTNQAFNYGDDAITLSTFTAYRSKFQLEKSLKRLHFRCDYFDYKQLKLELNNFTQLEELKLDFRFQQSIDTGVEDFDINLPNLKILDTSGTAYVVFFSLRFVLTTPKLKKLKMYHYEFDSTFLAHPDSIDHFEVLNMTYELTGLGYSLRNVQYFKIHNDMSDNSSILSEYPQLKTLVLNEFCTPQYENSLIMARHLVEQKRILKRPDLRIYYHSVEVVDCHKIDECMLANSILQFQMNNYSALCDNVTYDRDCPLDYSELMRLVNGSLPVDFFQKFRDFRGVTVSGKVNQEHLVQFLNRLEYLSTVQVNDAILDQTFFDGLHTSVSQLTELQMQNTSTLNLSYNFLLKLKLLETFKTDLDSLEFFNLSLALFKELKYFREIEFVDGNERVLICRKLHSNNYYSFGRYELADDYSYILKNRSHRIDFEQLRQMAHDLQNVKVSNELGNGIDFVASK